MYSRNRMRRQNCEACPVGAKMATIKRRCLAWGKDQTGWGYDTPEELGKGLDRGRPSSSPGRITKEIGEFERKPVFFQKPRKYMEGYQGSQSSCYQSLPTLLHP